MRLSYIGKKVYTAQRKLLDKLLRGLVNVETPQIKNQLDRIDAKPTPHPTQMGKANKLQ